MSSKKRRLESDIQRDIELAIGAEPDLLVLRNSVGMAKFFNESDMREFFVPYGLGKGSPDIVCLLHSHGLGIWLCLEIKVPGEKPEPDQVKCHAVWRKFGALVAVIHSADEAREAVVEARAEVQRRIENFRRAS